MKRKKQLLMLVLPLLPMLAAAQTPGLIRPAVSGMPNFVFYTVAADANTSSTAASSDFSGVCDWFYVQDGCDYYLPYGFNATAATYYTSSAAGNANADVTTTLRTFTQPTSVYLPYPFTMNSSSGVGVYGLSYFNDHVDSNPDDNTFVFYKQTSGLANIPYIVRIDDASTSLTQTIPEQNGVTVPASPTKSGTVFSDTRIQTSLTAHVPMPPGKLPAVADNKGVIWTLSGTNEAIDHGTAAGKGTWYFGTTGLWYSLNAAGSTQVLNPFRVFLIPSNPAATAPLAKVSFVDNTATGIGNVNSGQGTGNNSIYTITGQYVGTDIKALPKGMYIVNGKKVIK